MQTGVYCISVGIYTMHSLIKHSLIKVCIIYYTKVNKKSTCKYRMVDSNGNKSSNKYTIWRVLTANGSIVHPRDPGSNLDVDKLFLILFASVFMMLNPTRHVATNP